jgi:hypothetical protein
VATIRSAISRIFSGRVLVEGSAQNILVANSNILKQERLARFEWSVAKNPGCDHLRVRQENALLLAKFKRLKHTASNYLPEK